MLTTREGLIQLVKDFLGKVRCTPPCTLEGQTLEVKGWCSNAKELSREIAWAAACLANADGGVIVVGVLDKKAAPSCFKTCPYEDVNPDWIEERVSVLTRPAVTCRAYWVRELMPELAATPEGSIIIVGVPRTASLELHKFGGVCYKRKDNQCPIEYSTSADDYSDILMPSLTVEEVDPGSLTQIVGNFPASVRHGISGLDFLRNAGLVRRDPEREQRKDLLTVAGLLLLGKPATIARTLPHAQVAFSFLDHSGLSKAGRTETLNVFQAVPRFVGELQGVWPLQTETLREVLVNALIHRDYRARAIMEITVSDQRISFQNPGSLLGGLTPQNLVRAHPIYRNFRLAEAARQVGLCRKYGDGIDRIYYNCLSGGLDFPLISTDADSFRISLCLTPHSAFAQFVRSRSQALDNLDRIIVIKTLYARAAATLQELSLALQRTPDEAQAVLNDMRKLNMIDRDDSAFVLATSVRQDIKSFEPEARQTSLWPSGSQ
jgi:ATP-dependent DNA helicase RecG